MTWKVIDSAGAVKITGAGGGGISYVNFSAGTTSNNLTNIVFSNSNGVSFGLNGSTITASVVQSNQTVGLYFGGNTTGESSSSTVDARSITFGAVGPISMGMSAPGFIVVSAVQSNQSLGVYASSNTTGQSSSSTIDARSLTFRGAGIVSVGMSGGEVLISASAAGAADGVNILAAGTQTANTTGTVVFSNSNGITFGMSNNSVITASHNGITQQSTQPVAISGSNGSFNFSTVTFGNLNGLSFYTSNGSMVGSYTVPTQSVQPGIQSISAGTTRATTGEVVFSNSNGITFGLNGQTITASHNGLTSQSNQAVSGSNGSFTFQTVTFGNLNGLSFYTSNGSMVGSYTVPTQSNQTIGAYAVSNTTLSTSGTIDARSLSFQGAGVASVGVSNGSVIISVPAGGGGLTNINVSAGTTSQNLSNFVFSNSNGVSFGLNGSTITASVAAGAGVTVSEWVRGSAITAAGSNVASNSCTIVPFDVPYYLACSALEIAASLSRATQTNTSSGGFSVGISAVLYSRNAGTLSSIASGSTSVSTFHQSNSTSSIANARKFTLSLNAGQTLTPGKYWLALHVSTTTAGQTSLALGFSMGVLPTWATGFGAANYLGSNTTNTRGIAVGQAVIATAATRASLAFSDITGHSGNSASLANIWFGLRDQSNIW